MRLFEGTEFDIPPRCDRCGELEEACACEPEPEVRELLPPEKQTARVGVEKRKRGKTVTVIRNLRSEVNDLAELLTQLKTRCGAGGTVKDDVLEIQGNHVDRVREELQRIGYRVQ